MITVSEALDVLDVMSGVDWATMSAQVQSGDIIQQMTAVETIADVVAQFFPDVKYASDAAALLILAAKAKRAHLWAPGDPADPAMERAAGPVSQAAIGG